MRITAFATGFAVATAASLATLPQAQAQGGAWALLTNDHVVEVEKKFIEGLKAYQEYREGKETKDKKKRAEDEATTGLLGDLQKATRDRARNKSLGELIAELNPPKDPKLTKYSKDYAKMLYEAFEKDPKKYSELVGEISAGEYGRIPATIEKASAAVLTKAVSEYLEAPGFETSKELWDAFTGNIEDFQDVGSSLLRGDWPKFRTSLKALGYKKARKATEEAVSQTISYAFGGGKLGAAAGSAYYKVIEAEIEFLEWSKKYLDRRYTQPCLDRYTDTYRRVGGPGARDVAYDEFKQCSEERGKFFGFAALEAYIVQNGLDADAIYRQLAEDYRLGNARNVQDWLNDLIESRKRTVEEPWEKEYNRWAKDLADTSRTFNQASGIFINGIIEDVIGETKLKELEAAAAKALLDTFQDMQKLRRAADGVTGACTAFDAAKAQAEAALTEGKKEEEAASALDAKAKQFAGCTADATALTSLKRLFERAQKVNEDFTRAVKDTEAGVDAACKAAEAVATKTSEDEARTQLESAKQRAEAVQKSIEAAQAAFKDLTDLAKRAGEVKPGGDKAARDELAQWALDAETNAAAREALATQLKEAQAKMAAAVRTAQNLEGYGIDQANKIKPVLAPHRGSTLRAQILAVEDEIKNLLDGMADCRRNITDSFTKGDGDVPSWKVQKIPALSGQELQRTIAAARAKCPDAPAGEDPAATQRAIADFASRADPEASIANLARTTVERCLAQAGLSFTNVRNAANAVLTMQAPIPDDVTKWAGKWTMADGSGSMQLYDGEYISKGTYSWTPPPANVGPQGFSISMTATCQTGSKQGSTATGTGMSVEGFDVVTSAGDRTPVDRNKMGAPANCKTGESNSGSITLYVVPRTSYYEGEVAKIKIGAFWGPGVTYRYVAGKPKQ